jgi:predicted nucleic acid-binding protein
MIFLDTNVISETMRLQPDAGVVDWIEMHDSMLCLSTIVIAETAFGIFKVRPEQRSPRWVRRLAEWSDRLSSNIYSFDEASAEIYGKVMGTARLQGRAIDTADGMIAAIALRHNAALATRNTAHFQIPGLKLINPWQHPA